MQTIPADNDNKVEDENGGEKLERAVPMGDRIGIWTQKEEK